MERGCQISGGAKFPMTPAVARGRRWLEGALTAARPQRPPKAAQLPSTASTCIRDSYHRPAHYRHAWGAVWSSAIFDYNLVRCQLYFCWTLRTTAGWSPSIRYSSPVQLTPRILFHLPHSSWPYRSAICMCTESTYSHISRMIALRKQTGQYTNDLVSMHTNASTILTRLCGLKVPLRQSFAQRFVWSVYTTMVVTTYCFLYFNSGKFW